LVPSVRDGRPDGVKIYAVNPEGLVHRIGLRSGDTILAVNDRPLHTDEDVRAAYEALRGDRAVVVRLRRRDCEHVVTVVMPRLPDDDCQDWPTIPEAPPEEFHCGGVW
jgi:S1-C subfamily serine protease